MKADEERLIQEVLAENEQYLAFEAELQGRALGEYRRQVWLRKVKQISAVAATLTIIGGASWMFSGAKQNREVVALSGVSRQAPTVSPEIVSDRGGEVPKRGHSTALSDEELLALFPPNSCFLAEVDGKTILVFRDPELERRYLE